MGIIPALLACFGVSSYVGSEILWGLGWTPVVGLFAIALIFGVSYILNRRMFATRPRDEAMGTYWRLVRTTAFTAGLWFFGAVLLSMTVIYGVGGGSTKMTG